MFPWKERTLQDDMPRLVRKHAWLGMDEKKKTPEDGTFLSQSRITILNSMSRAALNVIIYMTYDNYR